MQITETFDSAADLSASPYSWGTQSGVTTFAASGGAVSAPTSGERTNFFPAAFDTLDQDIQFQILNAPTSSDFFQILARLRANGTNYGGYYVGLAYRSGGQRLELWKYEGDSNTATISISTTYATNDVWKFSIRASGGNAVLSAYRNGSKVTLSGSNGTISTVDGDWVDSSPLTDLRGGMYSDASGGSAAWQWDNLVAGDAVATVEQAGFRPYNDDGYETVSFGDDFNRANGAPGANYGSLDGGTPPTIVDNRLESSAAGHVYINRPGFAPVAAGKDHYVEANMYGAATIAICANLANTQYYYVSKWSGNTVLYVDETPLDSTSAFADGSIIRLAREGNDVVVYDDDVEILRATDTTYNGGYIVLGGVASGDAIDNVSAWVDHQNTPYGPQDTNFTAPADVNKLVRFLLQASGDPASFAPVLRAQINGTGGYLPVPVGPGVSENIGAVSYNSIGTGTSTTSTTSHNVNYPTMTGATSKTGLYLVVTGRSNTASTEFAVTGGGWTLIGSLEGGTGTWGVDTGTRRVAIFRKDSVSGSESGTITVTLAGTANNTLRGSIIRVDPPDQDHTIEESFASGADTTNGTGYSATAGANQTYLAGDLLLVATAQNIDSGTLSSISLAATGVTFGTVSSRASTAATGGNDHRHIVYTAPVNSVTGTPNVAATWAYTISAAGSGPTAFLRIRARRAEVINDFYIAPSSNVASGGEATTQRLTGGTGTFDTGLLWDDENGSDSIDLGEDRNTEIGWVLCWRSGISDDTYADLKVYNGETALDGAAARWTVGTPDTGETGAGAVALGNIEVAGAGDVGRFAAGGITLGGIGVSGGAIVGRSAAAVIALGGIEVAGAGGDPTEEITGDGAVALGGIKVAGAGVMGRLAAAAVQLGKVVVTGAGTAGRVAAAAVTLGAIKVAGAGVVGRSGTAAIPLGSIKVAGSGTGFAIITGDGAISLGGIEVAAAGIVGRFAAAAITLGKVTVSGAAAAGRSAEGAITLGGIDVAGAGRAERFGVGAVALGGIEVAGAGAIFSGEFASAVVVLGGIEVAGAAVVGRTAAGAVTLGPLAVSGAADVGRIAAGSITLAGIRVQASEAGGSGLGDQQYIIYMDRDMRDPWRKGMRVW